MGRLVRRGYAGHGLVRSRDRDLPRLLLVAAGIVLLAFVTGRLQGQGVPRTLQDSLDAARKQRLALEAQLEKTIATGVAERARSLAMGNEAGTLQKLETMLDSAQQRLLVQRDRIRLLRDAATQTDKAILVILLRADVVPDGDISAIVTIDAEAPRTLTITPDRAKTLLAGAADELYRGEIAPVEHKVIVTLGGRGLSAVETISLPASPREVRYVEFALRGGRLVPTTWTSRASAY